MLFLATLLLVQPLLQANSAPARAPHAPAALTEVSRQQGPGLKPEIWCVNPTDGRVGDPILILGRNFGPTAVAFFDLIPSVPLSVVVLPAVPKVGNFCWMLVPVPITLTGGQVRLTVLDLGLESDAVPFTIRLSGGGYSQGPDPELWCSFPGGSTPGRLVALFGSGLTGASIPYFGNTPSLNLGRYQGPFYPGYGSFTVLVTIVPHLAPGTVPLTVHTGAHVTDPVSFRIH